MFFNATGQSQAPICLKCRRAGSLRLHARLPEADGFPEVQCLECSVCGEVVVLERFTQPEAGEHGPTLSPRGLAGDPAGAGRAALR